ncbi:MAG: hypothetical protein WAT19_16235 [Ferruginibacter sp.]
MKKLRIIFSMLAVLFFTAQEAEAQYYFFDDDYYDNPWVFEVGGSINAMNCLTDIGGKKGIGKKFVKDLNIGKTHASAGFFAAATYKNAFAFKAEATFGKVSANDNVLAGVTDIAKERFNRNTSFQSTITEFSATAEIHPLFILVNWPSMDVPPPRYSPYFLGGIGYFSFNPQAQSKDGRMVDLQPLRTEGQGFVEYPDRQVYKLKQLNIPIGLGVKYELSSLVNLRGEFVYRMLNTDYLDDVSTRYSDPFAYTNPANNFPVALLNDALEFRDRQIIPKTAPGGKRGSPSQKDAFFSFNVKLSLVIGRERIR